MQKEKTSFDIFPAIDLLDGKSVRLAKGKRESAHTVHSDPLQQFQQYAAAGARWVHVVHLNAAFGDDAEQHAGARSTDEQIKKLVAQGGLQIQLGGGIRTVAAVERALAWGVSRIVIGTWAVTAFDIVMELVRRAPDRFVIGVDSLADRVAVHGWTQSTQETTLQFAQRLKKAGAKRVLFTEVERDGLLQGAAIEASSRLAEYSGLEVIASGGVRGLDDIRALSLCPGVCGVVTGKALAVGSLSLTEALSFQKG